MRVAGFLVVALMLILGVIGLLAPDRLFALAHFATTTTGLYVVAAVRLAIGIILLAVARRSRFPRILRLLGALALIGGIVTLLIGTSGAQTIAKWAATYGTMAMRGFGLFALALGTFIAYAISGKTLAHPR